MCSNLVTVTIITQASVGKPESQNASCLVSKRGVMLPGVPSVNHRNYMYICRDESAKACVMYSLLMNAVFCEESLRVSS